MGTSPCMRLLTAALAACALVLLGGHFEQRNTVDNRAAFQANHPHRTLFNGSAQQQLLVEGAIRDVPYAIGLPGSEQRQAPRERQGGADSAAVMPQAVAAAHAGIGHRDLADDGKRDERAVHTGARIGIVAAPQLHVSCERRLASRLPVGDRAKEVADDAHDVRRRPARQGELEFLLRACIVAEEEVAARKLHARALVAGIEQQVALERQHTLARLAGVDGCHAEGQVEGRLAEPRGCPAPEFVGGRGLAPFQQRA